MKYNPFKKGKKMTEQTQPPEAENPNAAAQTEERAENTSPTLESLQARIAELEGQLKDEQLRSLANEQNLRRRHQEKFAAEMLTVKDYLEMALQDQSGNFEAMKTGVSMTLNELNKAFDHSQIKEIPAEKGSKLDPHHHQAMQEIEAPGQEAGTIVGALKKGYTLNERVLRPAMVTVAKAA